MSMDKELAGRIRDAFDDPSDLLEALDISYTDLMDILEEQGYITEQTLPFVFVEGLYDDND